MPYMHGTYSNLQWQPDHARDAILQEQRLPDTLCQIPEAQTHGDIPSETFNQPCPGQERLHTSLQKTAAEGPLPEGTQ